MLLISDTSKGIFFQDLFNGDRIRLGLWVMLVKRFLDDVAWPPR
jgi:hypothetical protein